MWKFLKCIEILSNQVGEKLIKNIKLGENYFLIQFSLINLMEDLALEENI